MTEAQGSLLEHLITIRRDLHRHPELSWREERTAGRVRALLDEMGISYRDGVSGTGVVADIPGAEGGPTVALRADMDALPVQEETGLAFASEAPGVMHACGHDGHTTILLGAARLLLAEDDRLATVRLIFQPAEEVGAGAQAMIDAGALDGVQMIFGGHIDPRYAVGTIVAHAGAVNASADTFLIRLEGVGGHAARPHECVDAVVAGSHIVTALQTIVSREVNPAHPAVVTVGRFEAGTVANVIAGHAKLLGTIRTQEPDVRTHVIDAVTRTAESIAQLHGIDVSIQVEPGPPPVINTPEMATLGRAAAAVAVGEDNVTPLRAANMGGEDFAFYLERIPGCFVRYGAGTPGHEPSPAHSSRFDFDERVLESGARYLAAVAKLAGTRLASAGA